MDMDDLLREAEEMAERTEELLPSPASDKPPVGKLSVRHRAIADFLLTNPEKPMREVAAHFGVTPSWLSTIVHSDLFQELLREKEELIFHSVVVPLRQKVQAAAHIGVEKVAEALHHASSISDKTFVVETTEKLLRTLDYGTPKAPPGSGGTFNQQNIFVAEKAAVEQARDVMRQIKEGQRQRQLTDGKEVIDIDTEKLLNSTA